MPQSDPGHSPAPLFAAPSDAVEIHVQQVRSIMEGHELEVERVGTIGLIGRDAMGAEIRALVTEAGVRLHDPHTLRSVVVRFGDDDAVERIEGAVVDLLTLPARAA